MVRFGLSLTHLNILEIRELAGKLPIGPPLHATDLLVEGDDHVTLDDEQRVASSSKSPVKLVIQPEVSKDHIFQQNTMLKHGSINPNLIYHLVSNNWSFR